MATTSSWSCPSGSTMLLLLFKQLWTLHLPAQIYHRLLRRHLNLQWDIRGAFRTFENHISTAEGRTILPQAFEMLIFYLASGVPRAYCLQTRSGTNSYKNWSYPTMADTLFYQSLTRFSWPIRILSKIHKRICVHSCTTHNTFGKGWFPLELWGSTCVHKFKRCSVSRTNPRSTRFLFTLCGGNQCFRGWHGCDFV